ncbi:MAG TPA: SUMF1/EgtB/PvdO family nonheme iron enzyme [Pyrinomonadaceae bacterium]|nr:SUMF1/EgtB/PvdO family nonheme iron enzyme [Pyrinomonadaceae bacterium]
MKECPACNRCFPDQVNHCPTDGDGLRFTIQGDTVLDGRYQLERRLGAGGMGIVFKGRHIFLKTQHAIKVILPDLVGNDPSLVTRFRQEAMAAAAIHHPNTISVTDFGVVNNTMPFLVMEFLEGRSLHDLIAEEGRFTPERALEFIIAVAQGVGAAHRQGIVHRDLKPLNIMLRAGQEPVEGVKVLDFGLAKIKSGDLLGSFVAAKTQGMMGSPFYMAPEQWGDDDPDLRADIYSLGVILYQMLTGDVPFRGASIPSIMNKHLTAAPPALAERGVSVPPEVERVVAHALEKETAKRPASIEEFVAELTAALEAVRGAPAGATTEAAPTALFNSVAIKRAETHPPPEGARTGEQRASERGGLTALDADAASFGTVVSDRAQRTGAGASEPPPPPTTPGRATVPLGANQTGLHTQAGEDVTVEPPFRTPQQAGGTSSQNFQSGGVPAQNFGANVGARPGSHDAAAQRPFQPTPAADAPTASRKLPRALLAAAGLLALLCVVAGLFVVARRFTGGEQSNANANRRGGANANTSRQETAEPTKPDLVGLPGGSFMVGRNDVPPRTSDVSVAYQAWVYNQWPAHRVQVAPFAMDKTEVTNAEYAEFVEKTGYPPPPDWDGLRPREGQERWPVRNVTYEDAVRFAQWRSERDGTKYRLPTEDEWEFAARAGDASRLFPWGAAWEDGRANVETDSLRPVGSLPDGATPQGLHDMIGNVWELTSTQAGMYRGNNVLRLAPGDEGKIVVRGGSYQSRPRGDEPVSATARRWVAADKRDPVVGFRLVRANQ